MEKKTYKLGGGNEFITDNPATISEIEAAETELLRKGELNEDPKFAKYYDRIKNDLEYRNKKVISYVMAGRSKAQAKKEKENNK